MRQVILYEFACRNDFFFFEYLSFSDLIEWTFGVDFIFNCFLQEGHVESDDLESNSSSQISQIKNDHPLLIE